MASELLRFAECVYGEQDRMTVGGMRFNMSISDFSQKTGKDEVILLKAKFLLDAYREHFGGRPISNILEFGTWEGGSPIFFAAATNAKKIIGIDIRDPAAPIMEHAAKFGDRLQLVYNTSQADRDKVGTILDRDFGGPIDLVIDDASHQYELTKAAFEIAFSRLRVGGYYVIEDWNWAHYSDRRYDNLWADQPALSNLILEIVLAAGTINQSSESIDMSIGAIGPIRSLTIYNWGVIIEKGAEVPKDFRLADLILMGDKRKYARY